jgi:hypothetical protein
MALQATGTITTVTFEAKGDRFEVRTFNTRRRTGTTNGFKREADALGYFRDLANTYAPGAPIRKI